MEQTDLRYLKSLAKQYPTVADRPFMAEVMNGL